ncbi:GNAT family N-acetyltransferase [Lysinibacillus sp. NPDC096418]|uniref:GNAT family N-acetyltransferase n=1 Tax=Lysinibacillus sp. NPDC096418 TaxID=3364138 RepID=UPI003803AFE0
MYYIEVPKKLTPAEQKMMIELEQDAFSSIGAVDEQTLVPIARYGKMIWYRAEGDVRPIAVAEIMRSYENPETAYIFGYYVRSDWQGKGTGRQFLQEVIALLRKDGFSNVTLTVNVENQAAIVLYERCGFVIKETRSDEFGFGENRYCMMLELKVK